MRLAICTAIIGLGLVGPASAQVDISKMLQGLTTGNQNEDQKLQEAYSRGYRNGMKDARQGQSERRSNDGDNYRERRSSERDDYNDGDRDDRRPAPVYRDSAPQGYNRDR